MAEGVVTAVWREAVPGEPSPRSFPREVPIALESPEPEGSGALLIYSEEPGFHDVAAAPGTEFERLARLADPLEHRAGKRPEALETGNAQTRADRFARECARKLETLAGRPVGWLRRGAALLEGPGGDSHLARLLRILAGSGRNDAGGDVYAPSADWFPGAGREWRPEKREGLREEDRPPPEPLDASALAAMLSEGGRVAAALPGFESRDGQLEMVRAVTEALNTGRHLMVEAGTGIGKSLAYLLPALAWSRLNRAPVVVSTNTRNLQSQLFEKDLPMLREAFEDAPRIALIKGRSNYLCLRRLFFLCETFREELEPGERPRLAEVLAWAAVTAEGDLDELTACLPDCASLARNLCSTADDCPGKACRYYRRCVLWRARNASRNADLVVANHSLVFAEMGRDPVGLPPCRHLVFDEAHNLEDAATRHFSVEVSWMRARRLLRRIRRRGRGKRARGVLAVIRDRLEKGLVGSGEAREASREAGREAALAVEEATGAAEIFFDRLQTRLAGKRADPRRYRAADLESPPWAELLKEAANVIQAFTRLGAALETLAAALEAGSSGELRLSADLVYDARAAASGAQAFQEDLKFLLSAESEAHVYWIEPRTSRSRPVSAALVAAPLEIGEALARDLYEPMRTLVFCSATLSVNGSFAFMSERLGLNRIDPERLLCRRAPSPFDFARQVRVRSPMFLPEPGNSAGSTYAEALADLLVEVFRRTRGRALGLFTSYAMLRRCALRLTGPLDALGIDVLVQKAEGSRERLTRIFRAGGAVLLGTHSFWEGIDVVGEALSCVVLARLPFPAVGDPLVAARCERLSARGVDPFRGYMLPLAVIRFRQGFGRLIRHRDDKGVIIVADRRLWTRPYGVWFRRDLPCPVTRCETPEILLRELEEFFSV